MIWKWVGDFITHSFIINTNIGINAKIVLCQNKYWYIKMNVKDSKIFIDYIIKAYDGYFPQCYNYKVNIYV